MSRNAINPPSQFNSLQYAFSHAIASDGKKLIHCAGQTAWDRDCNLIGGNDVAAQARQALANLKDVLAAAGASPADVVRMRTYVVNHRPELLGTVGAAIAEFYGDALPAANTWIGVQCLALPEFLIEIEVTAQFG